MFTFGSSPVLDLDNARLFAQQFQLEEDRPTDVSPELQLYAITTWCSVWTLQDSLFDHRMTLMCSMRLYLLRIAMNAAVLIQ